MREESEYTFFGERAVPFPLSWDEVLVVFRKDFQNDYHYRPRLATIQKHLVMNGDAVFDADGKPSRTFLSSEGGPNTLLEELNLTIGNSLVVDGRFIWKEGN